MGGMAISGKKVKDVLNEHSAYSTGKGGGKTTPMSDSPDYGKKKKKNPAISDGGYK